MNFDFITEDPSKPPQKRTKKQTPFTQHVFHINDPPASVQPRSEPFPSNHGFSGTERPVAGDSVGSERQCSSEAHSENISASPADSSDSLTIIHYEPRPEIPEIPEFQRVDNVLAAIQANFANLGEFLAALFRSLPRDHPDNHFTTRHRQMVQFFLQGRHAITAVMIVIAIYNHRYSFPTSKSGENLFEREKAFSATDDAEKLRYARVAISIWATQLLGQHVFKEMHTMSRGVPTDPEFPVHITSSDLVNPDTTLHLFENFSLANRAVMYKKNLPLTWYLTECMARPKVKGKSGAVVVVRKARPHPIVQVIAISAGLLSRNRYANGFLALQMGVWLFATKAHTDIKRVFCRIGLLLADSTIRQSLNAIGRASIQRVRRLIESSVARDTGDIGYRLLVDNEQQYVRVREEGLCKENELRVGCGATAVKLTDFKPGAFHIAPLLDARIRNSGSTVTVEDIRQDIDTAHLRKVGALHILRALISFEPKLQDLAPDVSKRFRTAPIAKHRMRDGWKTEIQPLGCNSEREVETQGILRAIHDFAQQIGVTGDICDKHGLWVGGDGATFAAMRRAQDFLSPHPSDGFQTLGGIIPGLEIWHTRATMLNTLATNHYGPDTSKDPSSLSQNANATGMKRPTDTKSCDFYPTARSMTLFWEARVLDIWRIELAGNGTLHQYFENLAEKSELPTFDSLLEKAETIHDQGTKIRYGTPWTAKERTETGSGLETSGAGVYEEEEEEFNGDRVLANSILFVRHYLLWIEGAYAVAEGDIGRLWEILKMWIFMFSGSTNINYVRYLLEMYFFFKYEASTDLKDAIWNNWLVNLTGLPGHGLEGDLMQEHHNKWVEDLVGKHGGNFDDSLYHETISPNTHLFIHLKEGITDAYDLKRRSKSHSSPHLRNEIHTLLNLFEREELHLFRPTRSMGFIAEPLADLGYNKLFDKLEEEQEKRALRARILKMAQNAKLNHSDKTIDQEIEALRTIVQEGPRPVAISVQSTSNTISPMAMALSETPSPLEPMDNISTVGTSESGSGEYERDSEASEETADLSDQPLRSGSDLVPSTDEVTGGLMDEWVGDMGMDVDEMMGYDEDDCGEDSEEEEAGLSDDDRNWSDGDD
ncbi:hypothetical protein PM082_018428 [Marasmius tenuissimus]|nr:hypothetical protein PM082_018428 [Marasmius tenuissimus]